jgi:2-hydroxy-6-oxonona-2,4-dienedioate hydrolase
MGATTLTADQASNFVTTKLHKLHYYGAGEGHAVVLLHGSGPGASGWSNFSPNIEPLSKQFRVLAFDMPGWGKTDDFDPDADRDHVEALLLALDELGIDKAALIGNSMGGMTSIRFAVEHPDRISHLICMGAPAPGINIFTPGGGMSEGLQILIEAYQDPSPENFKRLVKVMAYDQAFATDELAKQRSENALSRPDHLASFGKTMASGAAFFNLLPRLPEITAPTMIIHGRDDRTIGLENGLRLVSAIPDSRLVVLNRCGHWAQIEHAAKFNRLVEQFVLNH